MDNKYQNSLNDYIQFKKDKEENKNEGVHDYSLLNSLLKANDEVNLHSKFIFSMINPEGLHYCGSKFLNLFLKQINCEGFLSKNNTVVHREKDNIDLLIHDGKHFIIIENKLDAIDQRYQITRYIQYIKNEFLTSDVKEGLSDKIRVVYLSKNRSFPKKGSDSCVGFKLVPDSKYIKWLGIEPSRVPSCLKGFSLGENTIFQYIHVGYFNGTGNGNIENWISESIDSLKNEPIPKKTSLTYAFNEYDLILKRLNKTKSWKNIMRLDEYISTKLDDKEQADMYELMIDAREALPAYVAMKLEQCFKKLNLEEKIVQDAKLNGSEQKPITPFNSNSCLTWLNKKGKEESWKNIGYVLEDENGGFWCFLLGTSFIYFHEVRLTSSEKGNVFTMSFGSSKAISSRENLLQGKKLNELIMKIGHIAREIS